MLEWVAIFNDLEHLHRKAKGSFTRFIHKGLVGP